ncbi:MAG TPA: penicillin-binding transpeptidase domain-containing protein, partial [Kofleriaceae bacterium]
KGMWKVNNEAGGTAYDHGISQVVKVMGKTGTAEVKKHHKDADNKELDKWNPNASHAWFAGWAPAEDPELAIVVLVEHGGAGGTVAWPVAERILDTYYTRKQKGDAKALPPPPIVPKKMSHDASTDQERPTRVRIPTRAMLKKQGERKPTGGAR